MKTKNKKILTRLSAVLATCLLLVALAVPCFADGVVSEESYCIEKISFTNGNDFYQWMTENYVSVTSIHFITAGVPLIMNGAPQPEFDENSDMIVPDEFYFISPAVNHIDNSTFIELIYVVRLTDTQLVLTPRINVYTTSVSTQSGEGLTLPNDAWDLAEATADVYYRTEFTPTVAPIDPDAPTRTGLYGELYHIIRDAIYGENALLDSTQEFTLTQIATWMTYIVILLPLVVIAIILFKIFVR